MPMILSVDLYKDPKDGSYVLVHYAPDTEGLGNVGYGKLTFVNENEMLAHGLDIVLQSLREFPTRRRTERCELELMPRATRSGFERRRRLIGVCLYGDELWVDAMRRAERGGYVG